MPTINRHGTFRLIKIWRGTDRRTHTEVAAAAIGIRRAREVFRDTRAHDRRINEFQRFVCWRYEHGRANAEIDQCDFELDPGQIY